MFSLYDNIKSKNPKTISTEYYVEAITEGFFQDEVLAARAEFQKNGKSKKYTFIKNQCKMITGSAVMNAGKKDEGNINYLNGFLVVDIDDEINEHQINALRNDKYTHIMHNSISGVNYCVFIKIDKTKDFKGIFDSVCEYYYQNLNINIDVSCSNKNRLRFLSYDPDLYYKSNSATYRKVKKHKEPKKRDINYVFTQSDFDNILEQIKERGLDLCKDDYFTYIRVGMAIANELGESGRDAFHLIASQGSKYRYEKEDKTYTKLCKTGKNKSSIGTIYYLCKQEGIEVYREKTRTIINRVKVAKSQGKPTIDSITEALSVANDIQANDEDKALIDKLINSNTDYSVNANADVTEIEQLINFINDTFAPVRDSISYKVNVGGRPLDDTRMNDIYLSCKNAFDFQVNKNDIKSILYSSKIKSVDVLKKFINENKHNENGYIDKYISSIHPHNEYNKWAFKKWIVGAIHNWFRDYYNSQTSPLTLVLCGDRHGTGKTSFIRNILPMELRRYFYSGKIDGSKKDSMQRMADSLFVFDDEFGGKGVKDVKEFKALSDIDVIRHRLAFRMDDESYKRIAALCGTSNEYDILKDVTGNRRILPIKVEKVNFDIIENIDTSAMLIEAYNLWKDGFKWAIYRDDEIQYLKENTEDNVEVMPIEELFFSYFSDEVTENDHIGNIYNQGEILDYLTNRTRIRITKYDIKDIFTKNNIKYKPHKIGGKLKKGVKLYLNEKTENNEEIPF